MNDEDPKPCAHCGNEDIEIRGTQINYAAGSANYYEALAECKECGSTMSAHGDSIRNIMAEVKIKWNRRTNDKVGR